MRITPDLIGECYQYTNKATTDRELRLRALKINAIENLGATLNQFDCFDLSDNNIKKLENLPLLPRLKCILLNNNRVNKIASNLQESIPNLERLILTNNYIQELGDIDVLSSLKNLKVLSLINNPITSKSHYRYYVIHKLPNLRLLDFSKIKRIEREKSAALFSGDDGDMLAKSIGIKSKVLDDNDKERQDAIREREMHNTGNKWNRLDADTQMQIQSFTAALFEYSNPIVNRENHLIDEIDILAKQRDDS